MTKREFEEALALRTHQTEQVLKRCLPIEEGQQKTLLSAMNYSMLAGGKRLRPLMIWETYRLFGGEDTTLVYPFMAALEMIHTHSLVHDDLPALDNDELRRGKQTTHVAYGEAMAILAGDALLNFAYETACSAFEADSMPDAMPRAAKALRILSSKTGVYGMLGGQSVDVESEGMRVDDDRLRFIYEMKTSALIECALMVGGCLGGADDEQLLVLEMIGRKIGTAFQIKDDLLDVSGDAALLGKPLHSDEKNEKSTYLTHHSFEEGEKAVEKLTQEAAALLDGLKTSGDKVFLRTLLLHLAQRNA